MPQSMVSRTPICRFGRGARLGWVLACAAGLAVAVSAPAAMAQDERSGSGEVLIARTGSHPVTGVVIQYVTENPQNPPAESLLAAPFEGVPTENGWAAPVSGQRGQVVRLSELPRLQDQRFTDTGLTLLSVAVVELLKGQGLGGVYVQPDPAQFRVEDGRVVDLRGGVTTVTLMVTLGTVTEMHTVGVGERLPADKTIDHPLHERVLARSPIKTGDLVYQETIDEYLYLLKRRPGRRADVALSAPGDEAGAVRMDYVITENRPWLLFAQIASTGTESTSRLRERFGFIHNDLTNSDDTLDIQYTTANFADTHQVQASYDRPFPNSDRWRWRVDGSWYQYTASDVGLPGLDFKGEGYTFGGSVSWNFYQNGPTFLDLVGGVHWKHVEVNNELAAIEGEDDFFVPSIALVLERNTEAVQTNAVVSLEGNVSGIAGTSEDLDALGRTDADEDYYVLRASATHDFYLEPYFDPYAESTGGLAHQIHLSMTGQYAFDNRFIPNEQQPVGGLYTVRGYPESATAGDSVLIGTAEYRYHLPRNLSPEPVAGTFFGEPFRWRPQYQYGPTDWDLVFKGFIDAAHVESTDRFPFEADNNMLGAGVGIDLALTRRFNLRVDWGFALLDLENGDGSVDVDAGHNELSFVLTLIY